MKSRDFHIYNCFHTIYLCIIICLLTTTTAFLLRTLNHAISIYMKIFRYSNVRDTTLLLVLWQMVFIIKYVGRKKFYVLYIFHRQVFFFSLKRRVFPVYIKHKIWWTRHKFTRFLPCTPHNVFNKVWVRCGWWLWGCGL